MKRYAKEFEWADMEESDAGEWVRYEDVRARLEAAERLHERALNERDTAHEALETERKAKVEWERLRKQAYSLYRAEGVKRERAESEAAAAEALLRRTYADLRLKGTNIGADYDAFLSAQPAASAAPCTAEERAVLDAMGDVPGEWLEEPPALAYEAPFSAELARRAAKEAR